MTAMVDFYAGMLRGILERMGAEATVSGSDEPERLVLTIQGADAGLLIGMHGATLDALQYLVNRMQARAGGDPGGPPAERKLVVVDAEGYRDRRNEALVEMAHKLAAKARRTGKPVAAAPMSAADRRVMHLALANEPGLSTQSEGEGAARHLVVFPEPGGAGAGGARGDATDG